MKQQKEEIEMEHIMTFATTGSEYLADGITNILKTRLPGGYSVERSMHNSVIFSNENVQVGVPDVSGSFAVVIHTQVPPVHNNFFELFALLDAIRNSDANDILLVFPYMPYVRSDRKNKSGISTMSVWLAHTINRVCGVKKVLLLEPHDGHIKHYFDPQAQEVSTMYLLAAYLEKKFLISEEIRKISKIVYPDGGAAKRYRDIAKILRLKTAYVDKDRPDDTESPDFKEIIGDVENFICFMIDDECMTAGTTIGDAENLIFRKAKEVNMMVTHPILNDRKLQPGSVVEKLEKSPIERMITTNSIPVAHKIEGKRKFFVISIIPLLGEAIKRIILGQQVSALHKIESVQEFNLL